MDLKVKHSLPRHVVIGAAGFLGRELVAQLLALNIGPVLAVDMVNTDWHRGLNVQSEIIDIEDQGAVSKLNLQSSDIVHHLASRLITPNSPRLDRYGYFARTSVGGTKNLLKHMEVKNVRRLVFWSTDMVYGPQDHSPILEEVKPLPVGPYGKTKVLAENLIHEARNMFLDGATIFRPRLIIGAGRLGILQKLFDRMILSQPIPLIGNGSNRFQFVSVADCARASVLAAVAGCPNETYNLGSDNPPTVFDLLTEFKHQIKSNSKLIKTNIRLIQTTLEFLNLLKISPLDPEQYRIAHCDMVLSTDKVKKQLSWAPQHSDIDMLMSAFSTYHHSK